MQSNGCAVALATATQGKCPSWLNRDHAYVRRIRRKPEHVVHIDGRHDRATLDIGNGVYRVVFHAGRADV